MKEKDEISEIIFHIYDCLMREKLKITKELGEGHQILQNTP